MYVCICNALRESEVRRVADEAGVGTGAAFLRHQGIAPHCGKCVREIHRIVREHGRDAAPAAQPH